MIEIKQHKHIYSMGKDNEPAAFCDPGETVVFHTKDCFSGLIRCEEYDWSEFNLPFNPATGPLYVNTAMPGDTLKVTIVDILVKDHGVMVNKPNMGIFGKEVKEDVIKVMKIEDGKIHFNQDVLIDADPMIGVIGTAPVAGEIGCGTPNNHGGNLDNKLIKIGSIVELPVFVPGALLAIGDLHASMGDGEIVGTGIEVAGTVTIKVEVIKQRRLTNPRVVYRDRLYVIASGIDLDMASGIACKEMLNVLMKYNSIDRSEASMLMSAVGNLEICQVVNSLTTVRFGMALQYIDYDIK